MEDRDKLLVLYCTYCTIEYSYMQQRIAIYGFRPVLRTGTATTFADTQTETQTDTQTHTHTHTHTDTHTHTHTQFRAIDRTFVRNK